MEIDAFTLVAQIINFLVLVWLLKRFLYGRIVQAMNDREGVIARQLDDAARVHAAAQGEAETFRARNRELEEEREHLRSVAAQEIDAQKRRLLEKAHEEVDEARARWLDSLRREQTSLLGEVRERVGQQVLGVARRALRELADEELEQRVVTVFLRRLEALDRADRGAIVAAMREVDREIEIRTAFPLSRETRDVLTESLRTAFDEDADVRFTTAPDMLCGIELRAHSHRLVWNLDSYLEGLEDRVFGALKDGLDDHASPG